MQESINELKGFVFRQGLLLCRYLFQLFVDELFVFLCEFKDGPLETFENAFEHSIHLDKYSVYPFRRLWWGSNPQPPA